MPIFVMSKAIPQMSMSIPVSKVLLAYAISVARYYFSPLSLATIAKLKLSWELGA